MTGRILEHWTAKESKEETYMCVRKYMILFVHENNNPLHGVPLQLTAKGCFQYEFDQKLCEFRGEITKAYVGTPTYHHLFYSVLRNPFHTLTLTTVA